VKNWKELLVHEMADLYDAEQQLVKALPKLAEGASDPELKQAFENHLAETEIHVQRLEQAAKLLGKKLGQVTCEGMKGLIKEGDGILKVKDGEPEIVDAALMGAAQKVEHYEMLSYESLISLSEQLGLEQVAALLQQSLDEEVAASDKLAELSGEEEAEEEISEAAAG
jgi:ferritin-like metal-binding protein YciE